MCGCSDLNSTVGAPRSILRICCAYLKCLTPLLDNCSCVALPPESLQSCASLRPRHTVHTPGHPLDQYLVSPCPEHNRDRLRRSLPQSGDTTEAETQVTPWEAWFNCRRDRRSRSRLLFQKCQNQSQKTPTDTPTTSPYKKTRIHPKKPKVRPQ